MIEDSNDSSNKLQNHLKLLKNEYSKLQKSYSDLQRKFDDLQAKSSNETAGDNSSFNSRLVMVVSSLYGRKTYSDLTIKLKEKQIPAHKFVLNARSEEWREEVLSDVTELDWSDLDVDAGYALLRWIYTDIVDLQQQDSLSIGLLRAAHKFKLNSLMGLCERALVSSVNVRSCVSFYCVAEEVGAANLLEYCSSLISINWDELLPQDFVHMSGALLYKMLKSKTKFPLHAAIRLRREDVVFLCLVESEGSDFVNSLSPQGYLPLGQALIEQHEGIANLLVQNGNANVNARNADGSTLLIDSIKRGDGFSARFLLEHECDVNLVTSSTEDTALHIICTYAKKSTDSAEFKEMHEIGKTILSKSIEINRQNAKGFTPLHLAITCGNFDMIEELLKIPETDLNLVTKEGKSALLLALFSPQFTDFSIAKRLLDNGAEANEINDDGDNILQFLIKSGKTDAAIFMCDHVNLNYKNQDHLTALHLASKFGHAELVKKILACGALPNIQTGLEEMKTALHFAVEANSEEVISAFVDFKSDVGDEKPDFNIRCADGDTPLSLALSLKHNDLVSLLIRGGSDVNARNGEMTLLHQAIIKESPETAIFLLEQGADINALTGDQESPLQLAIHCRLESVVDALCSRGVALSAPNNKGDCPLWSALESEQENIASVLVRHGVDPDCWSHGQDGCIQTLLHRAIDENNEYTAMFLIRSGCDLDSPRQPSEGSDFSSKESPLHLCCSYGLAKVAQALIEHGANVNSLNHDNKTPLHVAIQNQHELIITLLLRYPNIDLKIRDRQGNTPFATALTVRNHKAAEKILERMPTAADQYDSRGRNFLHLAVMKDDLESVLFLISIQVDVNSRVHDVNQATPLMLAASSENEMLIRNLMLAGARLNDHDSTQKTALHIAAERGRTCAVQALIQNGCDYDVVDAEGNNALHIAMRECMLPIVKELLTESRINAEVLNIKGRNPLHELCRCGRDNLAASICELFIECMPNYPINQPDLMGNTPLLLAYMRGETQLCRVLVKSGACLGAENKDGVSIFNYKLATNQLLYRLLDELSVESPWSSSEFCQECATKFSLTMRKHHCRHCGRQICSQCSNNDVPIIKFGINKPVRVCKVCFDVLQVGSH